MANIKSQIKRIKTNEADHEANKAFKSSVKTAIKKAQAAIDSKADNADALTSDAVTLIDKAVTKGIFHVNKAARTKSRLMTRA